MTYAESAQRGDVMQTFRFAVFAGTLWAIGISWGTAIRQIALEIVPAELGVVPAELLAVLVTTTIASTIALAVGCCSVRPSQLEPHGQNVPQPRRTTRLRRGGGLPAP